MVVPIMQLNRKIKGLMTDKEQGRFEFKFSRMQIILLFAGIAIMALVMFTLGMVVGKSVTDIKSSIAEPAKTTPASPAAPSSPAPVAPSSQDTGSSRAYQAQELPASQPQQLAAKQEPPAPPANSSIDTTTAPPRQIPIVKPVPEAAIVTHPATSQDVTAAQPTEGSAVSKRRPRTIPRKILPSKQESTQVAEGQTAAGPAETAGLAKPQTNQQKTNQPKTMKINSKSKPRVKTAASSPVETGKGYILQVGSFSTEQQANLLVSKLSKHGYDFYIHPTEIEDKGTWYQVRTRQYRNRNDADRIFSRLQQNEGLQPLIITVK